MLTRFDGPTVTLVVNPSAGRGRARRLLPKVCSELLTGMPDAHLRVHQATSFDDARLRCIQAVGAARPAAEGVVPDSLVVMGGDGMAHLGLNAAAETNVRLGVIPAGTGNDFCRGMGMGTTVPAAVKAIIGGRTRRVDVAKVTGNLIDGAEQRFVGCTVSTGYDAMVNRRANAITRPLGPLAYGWAALAELARFEPLQYRLTIDGVRRNIPAMLVGVSNSSTFGGGMLISPTADVTDELLNVTIIHPVSKATLLRLLPMMYNGSFVKDPAVETLTCSQITVDGSDLYAMADGEKLGPVPVEITTASKSLSTFVP